jgi:hypothetical protein
LHINDGVASCLYLQIHRGFTSGVNDIVAPMMAGDNTETTTADNDGFLNAPLINQQRNCSTLSALAQLMTAKTGVKITRCHSDEGVDTLLCPHCVRT